MIKHGIRSNVWRDTDAFHWEWLVSWQVDSNTRCTVSGCTATRAEARAQVERWRKAKVVA